ncbi:MAG TPA: sensor histidine kinase [Pseudonocardiaceae bacterium]|nr:sensor histidine kinase [Pseudonocardiaceae bacterium]
MRRLSLWLRRHPVVGDSVMAIVLALLTISESNESFPKHHPWYYWSVGALMVVPVVLRRRWPIPVAYVILAGGLLQLLTHGALHTPGSMPVRTADLALGIALYTLVVYTDRRRSLTYAGILAAGTVIDVVWRLQDRGAQVVLGTGALAIFGFAWATGEFVAARRAYHIELEARLRLLETERDQQATIAVAAERTRIARELHDVVAHAVSVMVVQADGAGYAVRSDPDLAEQAVRTISETGREALTELRRLLDVLRSDTDERDVRSPQPSVAGLPDLVERFRAVGLPVELTVRGHVADLPAAVGLGAYRIVQEALTNALKHAGAAARATVRVERVGGLVEVEILDDGGAGPVRRLAPVSGGNGLIGMRERATVLGGSLTVGRTPAGGWRVRATVPISAPHGTVSA